MTLTAKGPLTAAPPSGAPAAGARMIGWPGRLGFGNPGQCRRLFAGERLVPRPRAGCRESRNSRVTTVSSLPAGGSWTPGGGRRSPAPGRCSNGSWRMAEVECTRSVRDRPSWSHIAGVGPGDEELGGNDGADSGLVEQHRANGHHELLDSGLVLAGLGSQRQGAAGGAAWKAADDRTGSDCRDLRHS